MWEHFERGDRRAVASFFAPDLVWHLYAGTDHAMSGDYVGWEQNAHLQRLIREESGGTFHARALEVRSVGTELGIATLEVRLLADGESATMSAIWIGRVVDGSIVEVWDIISDVPRPVLAAAARAVKLLGRLPR